MNVPRALGRIAGTGEGLKPGDTLAADLRADVATTLIERTSVEQLVVAETPDVSWSDIGGLGPQIGQIRDALELPFTHPELFHAYGLRAPKGLLLYGPPGCGKTLIAKAVATSLAGSPSTSGVTGRPPAFLNIKGPELLSKFVGETERQIRAIFDQARKAAAEDRPVVIFFDEMEALFRTRGTGVSSDVETMIVPQVLAEIDGVESLRNVVIIGASNREDMIDPAILRPGRLEAVVGQEVVRGQLSVVLRASLARGTCPDHVLLSGPPGLGKTTLAMIIAAEVDGSLRLTSGPAIQHAGDLAAILSSLEEGDVLFIDEIHRLARTAEEMLYLAMEDFRVDIVVGKGPGATSIPLSLPPFTVVGATTRAGLLPAPLRDRFGFTGHLDYYGPNELTRILTRSAGLLGVSLEADAAKELASRSRGTPRIANRLLRRVQDWAEVHGRPGRLDLEAARGALDVFEVDALGLDRLDRQVLEALCTRFGGGPVGLTTLAVSVGEEPETVETVAEPYLVREGLGYPFAPESSSGPTVGALRSYESDPH